jgi:hypothetical protein
MYCSPADATMVGAIASARTIPASAVDRGRMAEYVLITRSYP